MANNLTLSIMAAGMGSRYGGLKQIERFGENGEILMEYAIYDALKAGFDRVVLIIKEETLDLFNEIVGDRLSRHCKLDYAFQRMTDVPDGFEIPEGRVKPWGTAQAVASLCGIVNEPFCVINADDFYGARSFQLLADYLKSQPNDAPYRCCMAGYAVGNTLSEYGAVTRGVCETRGEKLTQLVERHKILRRADGVIIDEASGTVLSEDTSVSMNMFGFQAPIPALLKERFGGWLEALGAGASGGSGVGVGAASGSGASGGSGDLLKGEYLLPTEVGNMVQDGTISMAVLPTTAKWYGVTYQEDKPTLVDEIRKMIATGVYPERLW